MSLTHNRSLRKLADEPTMARVYLSSSSMPQSIERFDVAKLTSQFPGHAALQLCCIRWVVGLECELGVNGVNHEQTML